jgi:hypothetical protein
MSKPANLLLLGPRQADAFRRAVEARRGKVLVLVHPFYHEAHGTKRIQQVPGYRERLEKLIRAPVPLVVFEEHTRVRQTAGKLDILGRAAPTVFVATEEQGAAPHAPGSDALRSPPNRRWAGVRSSLARLGARHLYLAGELYDTGGREGVGCVNTTHRRLESSVLFKSVRVLPRITMEL